MKKGQILSVESYVGIVIILIAITSFYFIMNAKDTEIKQDNSQDAEIITERVIDDPKFKDNHLTEKELETLIGLNCTELKDMFNTNKNICIYFKDKNNKTILLDNATGIGCPGLKISNKDCGLH